MQNEAPSETQQAAVRVSVGSFSVASGGALHRSATLPVSLPRRRTSVTSPLGIRHDGRESINPQISIDNTSPQPQPNETTPHRETTSSHLSKGKSKKTPLPSVSAIGANAVHVASPDAGSKRNYADVSIADQQLSLADARLVQQVVEAVREGGDGVLRHVLTEWALRVAACEAEVADYFSSKLQLETMQRVVEQQAQKNSDLERTCDALQFRLQNVVAVAAAAAEAGSTATGGGGRGSVVSGIGDLPLFGSQAESGAATAATTSTTTSAKNREMLLQVSLQTMLDSIEDPTTPPSEQLVTQRDDATGDETTTPLLVDPNDVPQPKVGEDLITQLHTMRAFAVRMKTKYHGATSKLGIARQHLRKQHEELSKSSGEAAHWKAQAGQLRGVCQDVKQDLELERIARKKQVDALVKDLSEARKHAAHTERSARADAKSLGERTAADITALNRTNQSLSLEVDRLRQFERRATEADATVLSLERQLRAEREEAAALLEAEQQRYYHVRSHVETALYSAASGFNGLALATKVKLPDADVIAALDASVPSLREGLGEALLDQQLHDLRSMLGCVRRLLVKEVHEDPDVAALVAAEREQLERIHSQRSTIDRMLLRVGGVDALSPEYRDDIKDLIAEERRMQEVQQELEEASRLEAESERQRMAQLKQQEEQKEAEEEEEEEAGAAEEKTKSKVAKSQKQAEKNMRRDIAAKDLENDEKQKARVSAVVEDLRDRSRKQFDEKKDDEDEQHQEEEEQEEDTIEKKGDHATMTTEVEDRASDASSSHRTDERTSVAEKASSSTVSSRRGSTVVKILDADKAAESTGHSTRQQPLSKEALRSKVVEKVREQTMAARGSQSGEVEGGETTCDDTEDAASQHSADSWDAELSILPSSVSELKEQTKDKAKGDGKQPAQSATKSSSGSNKSKSPMRRAGSGIDNKSPQRRSQGSLRRENSSRWGAKLQRGEKETALAPTDVDAAADDAFVAKMKQEVAEREEELRRREALAATFAAPLAAINHAERTRSDQLRDFGDQLRREREANLLRCREILGMTQHQRGATAAIGANGLIKGGIFADLDGVVIDPNAEFGSPKALSSTKDKDKGPASKDRRQRSVGAGARGKLLAAATLAGKVAGRGSANSNKQQQDARGKGALVDQQQQHRGAREQLVVGNSPQPGASKERKDTK